MANQNRKRPLCNTNKLSSDSPDTFFTTSGSSPGKTHSSPIDPAQIPTLAEIAERLKVSERWVYEKSRRRCQNQLPVIRIGRYLRFHWIDVSAWLRRESSGGVERAA